MYTLKITDENTVVTTVKESIVERSNYVDKIQIVTSKMYREQIDMSDTTVYMKYKLPVSDKIKMTQLIINNLEYEQNYIQYLIPVDAALTAEAGDIEVSFTFLKLVANEDGTYTSYIRKPHQVLFILLHLYNLINMNLLNCLLKLIRGSLLWKE